MRIFIWIVLVAVLISSVSGCKGPRAAAERIGDDIDWILLDGDPDIDK